MNRRGQALVESLSFFTVIGILLVSISGFTKWFLIKQKLLLAARMGAIYYSSGHFTAYEVRTRVRRYLTTGSPTLANDGITIWLGGARDKLAGPCHLDEARIQYRPTSELVKAITPIMEESCVIKHAPHYGPGGQTLFGPPIAWTSGHS